MTPPPPRWREPEIRGIRAFLQNLKTLRFFYLRLVHNFVQWFLCCRGEEEDDDDDGNNAAAAAQHLGYD